MVSKTSEELKAELTGTFYGIDPESLLVERVTLTRGGTLTRWRTGKSPTAYRIKGGKPARGEVLRVFGLTDLVAISPRSESAPGEPAHPMLAALQRRAADSRRRRDDEIIRSTTPTPMLVTEDRTRYPDHRVLSQHDHVAGTPGVGHAQGVHPLAGGAVAAAGWQRDADHRGDTGD